MNAVKAEDCFTPVFDQGEVKKDKDRSRALFHLMATATTLRIYLSSSQPNSSRYEEVRVPLLGERPSIFETINLEYELRHKKQKQRLQNLLLLLECCDHHGRTIFTLQLNPTVELGMTFDLSKR